jgi:hypothetical protein
MYRELLSGMSVLETDPIVDDSVDVIHFTREVMCPGDPFVAAIKEASW